MSRRILAVGLLAIVGLGAASLAHAQSTTTSTVALSMSLSETSIEEGSTSQATLRARAATAVVGALTLTVQMTPEFPAVAADIAGSSRPLTFSFVTGRANSSFSPRLSAPTPNSEYSGDRTFRISVTDNATISLTVVTGSGTTQVTAITNYTMPSDVVLTITEDEQRPGVLIQRTAGTLAEGASMVGYVRLTGLMRFPTRVYLRNSPADPFGVEASSNTSPITTIISVPPTILLDVPAGQTFLPITIVARDDNVHTGDRLGILQVLSSESCNSFGKCLAGGPLATLPPGSAAFAQFSTFTVIDDESPPTVTLSASPNPVQEGGTSHVTASLSHPSGAATTITVQTTPVVPGTFDDFDLHDEFGRAAGYTARMVINAGETAGNSTVSVVSLDNSVYTGTTTVDLRINSAANDVGVAPLHEFVTQVVGSSTIEVQERLNEPAALTILDDETKPTAWLSLGQSQIDESGSDNSTTVTANIATPLREDLIVRLDPSPLVDNQRVYEFIGGSALTIVAGATASASLTITARDNHLNDSQGSRRVRIRGKSGPRGFLDPDGDPVTLADLDVMDDDETTVTLILSRSEISEFEANDQVANFVTIRAVVDETTIMVNGNEEQIPILSNGEIKIEVSVMPVAPATMADYTLSSSVLTIAAFDAESGGVLTITSVDNGIANTDKALRITGQVTAGQVSSLTNPSGGVTIIDNELDPILTLQRTDSDLSTFTEGGNAIVKARLQHPSSERTEVTVEVTPATEAYINNGANQTLAMQTLTIEVGDVESNAATITAFDNNSNDGPREINITPVTFTSNVQPNPSSLRLYIQDNDGMPIVSLEIEPDSRLVEADQTVLLVKAVLNNPSSAETEVDIMVDQVDSTALEGDDFTLSDLTLTIEAGSSESSTVLTITVVDDREFDPDEFIKLTHVARNVMGVNNVAARAYTVEIVDDEVVGGLVVPPNGIVTVPMTVPGGVQVPEGTVVELSPPGSEDYLLIFREVARGELTDFPPGFTDRESAVILDITLVDAVTMMEVPLQSPATVCLPADHPGLRVYHYDADEASPRWMTLPLPSGDSSEGLACGVTESFPWLALGQAVGGLAVPPNGIVTVPMTVPGGVKIPEGTVVKLSPPGSEDYLLIFREVAREELTDFPPGITDRESAVIFDITLMDAVTMMEVPLQSPATVCLPADRSGLQVYHYDADEASPRWMALPVPSDDLSEGLVCGVTESLPWFALGQVVGGLVVPPNGIVTVTTPVPGGVQVPEGTVVTLSPPGSEDYLLIFREVAREELTDFPPGFMTDGESTMILDITLVDAATMIEVPLQSPATVCLPADRPEIQVYHYDADEDSPRWMALQLPSGDSSEGLACGVTESFSWFALGMEQSDAAEAWLARFGRTVAAHVVEAVSSRLATSTPQQEVMLGGMAPQPALLSGALQTLSDGTAPDARALLSGSSFVLPLSGAGGTHLTVWGRGAYTEFDGQEDGTSLDGEVLTSTVGLDLARDRWLAGVAVSHSEGDGDMRAESSSEEIDVSMTGAHPYLHYETEQGISIWGLLGWGKGDLERKRDGESSEVDLEMRMGALGARGRIVSHKGFNLSLKSDALAVRLETDAEENAPEMNADVSRVRVLLESAIHCPLESGGSVDPILEAGLRWDEGDAETGLGMELGTRVRYADAGSQLTAELMVRTLMMHEESTYDEWGVGGSVRLRPDRTGRGPSLKLESIYGAAESTTGQLWSQSGLEGFAGQDTSSPSQRFEMELAYGMNALAGRGLLTPYVGFGQASGKSILRLGGRLVIGPSLSLSLEGRSDPDVSGITGMATFLW